MTEEINKYCKNALWLLLVSSTVFALNLQLIENDDVSAIIMLLAFTILENMQIQAQTDLLRSSQYYCLGTESYLHYTLSVSL